MIIQCEQCRAKFRLDDSRVTDRGVKVRCAKCKHVFAVKKDQPNSLQPADFSAIPAQSTTFGQEEDAAADTSRQEKDTASGQQPESAFDSSAFSTDDDSMGVDAATGKTAETGSFEFAAKPGEPPPAVETPPTAQKEPQPLSAPPHRKRNPFFTFLITIISLAVVSAFVFFGYSMYSEVKVKSVSDTGSITVRLVDASFVKNAAIGDLLVISGEAVNNFNKPRASIQIKGMVYDGNGNVLISRSAYCGNPLTKEQLATMPLDKIESSMANQFGDSLANMGVEPGKAIPFVVVIPQPPSEAKDYGVEPVGSTVAAGKQ